MTTCKLEIHGGNRPVEIFQSLDIKFAFVSKIDDNSYKQLHLAVKCRDFLGDCIWSGVTKQIASIWSFKFDASKTPIDTDKLRLSMKFPDKYSMENFIANFNILEHKEFLAHTKTSWWYPTDQDNTIIVEADPLWQSEVWKISLYSYYLKVISYKSTEDLMEPENRYAAILTKPIEEKLQNGDIIAFATNMKGLDYTHTGLVYIDVQGVRRLVHASSVKKKVVIDTSISEYIAPIKKDIGITILRPLYENK